MKKWLVIYYYSGASFEAFESEDEAVGFAARKKGYVVKVAHDMKNIKREEDES